LILINLHCVCEIAIAIIEEDTGGFSVIVASDHVKIAIAVKVAEVDFLSGDRVQGLAGVCEITSAVIEKDSIGFSLIARDAPVFRGSLMTTKSGNMR
jgi:hypothetical protein